MHSVSGADDFGFPLTALERLRLMQGGKLSEREDALPATLPVLSRGRSLTEAGDLGFTMQEWLDAVFENYCFDLRAGRSVDEARREVA